MVLFLPWPSRVDKRDSEGEDSLTSTERPDVAYYYPAPYWALRDSGWIKTLLLFFDQVSILLPAYMYGRHHLTDPSLTFPLEERGLLQILEPSGWVDQQMTEQLADVMVELLADGAFDDLPGERYFAELSMSRIGYSADVELADMLVEALTAKGLARPSEDGVSIPLHPRVRTTILVILGQLSRRAGGRRGLTVHPATNHPQAIQDIIRTFTNEPMPSAGKVVTLDLQQVSFDLDPVPLDDLLEFRQDHQQAHKAYMRDLHRFMTELAEIEDAASRKVLLQERREEINDAGHHLRRSTRRSLRKNLAGFSLGITGTAWSMTTGDILGTLLAVAGVAVTATPDYPPPATAYSYIFATQRQYG